MSKKRKSEIYTEERKGFFSHLFKFLVRFLYGKYTFKFHEEKPTKASIFVANHTYVAGPLVMQYQYPGNIRTWSNYKFFKKEDCLPYTRFKFADNRPRGGKIISFLLYLVNPATVWFYKKKLNAIPVYHDLNISKTFRLSSQSLVNGSNIAIYPEQVDAEFNGILSEFAIGFTYVAQTHFRLTKECVNFYPIYIAEELKEIHFGKPIVYDPSIPMKEQAQTIVTYLRENIMDLHSMLPPHTVIPMFKIKKEKKTKS